MGFRHLKLRPVELGSMLKLLIIVWRKDDRPDIIRVLPEVLNADQRGLILIYQLSENNVRELKKMFHPRVSAQ